MNHLTDANKAAVLLRLKLESKKIGMTELSRKTGIDKATLYRALSEETNPSFDTIMKIATQLGYIVDLKPLA